MRSPFKVAVTCGALVAVVVGVVIAEDLAPWNQRELAAIEALYGISSQEVMFRDGAKGKDKLNRYGTLSDLSDAKLIDSALGSGTKGGYLFEAAPSTTTSEFLWWGMATPTEKGDRYLLINTAGVVYAATEKPEIDQKTCQSIAGSKVKLTPVPRGSETAKDSAGFIDDWRRLAGKGSSGAAVFDQVKVGQVYVYSMGKTTVTFEVKSKNEKTIVIAETVEQKGVADSYKTQEQLALVADPAVFAVSDKLTRKPIKKETLTVSGATFDCQVVEVTDGTDKAQYWICENRFPFVLKFDDGQTVESLTSIGESKTEAAVFCPGCGKKFEGDAKFCPGCGKERPKAEAPATPAPEPAPAPAPAPWVERAEKALRAVLTGPNTDAIAKSVQAITHPTGTFDKADGWSVSKDGDDLVLVIYAKASYETAAKWRCNKSGHVKAEVSKDNATIPVAAANAKALDDYFKDKVWPPLSKNIGE
jgi:hypothetical protein